MAVRHTESRNCWLEVLFLDLGKKELHHCWKHNQTESMTCYLVECKALVDSAGTRQPI